MLMWQGDGKWVHDINSPHDTYPKAHKKEPSPSWHKALVVVQTLKVLDVPWS